MPNGKQTESIETIAMNKVFGISPENYAIMKHAIESILDELAKYYRENFNKLSKDNVSVNLDVFYTSLIKDLNNKGGSALQLLVNKQYLQNTVNNDKKLEEAIKKLIILLTIHNPEKHHWSQDVHVAQPPLQLPLNNSSQVKFEQRVNTAYSNTPTHP